MESICAELGYSTSEIRHALSQLRQHALEKLAAKQRADWIHLKIRFSGSNENKVIQIRDYLNCSVLSNERCIEFSILILLSVFHRTVLVMIFDSQLNKNLIYMIKT